MSVRPCGRRLRRLGLVLTLVAFLGLGAYFSFFHRPPVDDILAANRALAAQRIGIRSLQNDDTAGDDDYSEYYDEKSMDPAIYSKLKWQAWMEMHGFVSIGELYNKCDGDDRITMGKVAMLPDPKEGGVTSRTYVNTTLDYDVTDGEVYIQVWYNGKDLYKNHWPLCDVEDDMEDRIIYCPVLKGKKRYVKNMKIPNYLPKGRYEVKSWLTDQKARMLGCAYSDFTLG